MVGAGEKGLASSRWAPINTGHPPYYWTSNKFRHPASSSSATATATHTTTTTTTSTSTTRTHQHPHHQRPPPTSTAPITTPSHTSPTTTTTNGTTYPRSNHPYEPDASSLTRVPTPWSELSRFMKIARRMRWKLPFLGQAYRAATDRDLNTPDDRAEAELMFKLDFFEYYMLLERALVHLMGVFGVRITGAFGGTTRPGSRTPNGNGSGNGSRGGTPRPPHAQGDHRFHANVLEALDDPRNPLHPVLGASSSSGGDEGLDDHPEGDARYALARAKELRNRWKNADEPASSGPSAVARPLEDYDLERILESIFAGLEGAYVIAERYVAGVRALAAERGVLIPGGVGVGGPGAATPPMENGYGAGAGGGGEEEAQWEFMVDAMDWEAV
ncbi:hypothetical protein KVR01_009354 [Diaporthe batatas]|uniref:uncharacterized protein n=1 Tax=Diaporthe batatas TaxID=748121 RepID=UPI001D03C5EA|nr:uncharacterized protein KVR01_009354 [Diaporthe batatas]KAG8161090.1 hypothetical protein KVR01_009354 [Diaporthe batatas]